MLIFDVMAPAIEVWLSIINFGPYPINALLSLSIGIMVVSALIKLVMRWSA